MYLNAEFQRIARKKNTIDSTVLKSLDLMPVGSVVLVLVAGL